MIEELLSQGDRDVVAKVMVMQARSCFGERQQECKSDGSQGCYWTICRQGGEVWAGMQPCSGADGGKSGSKGRSLFVLTGVVETKATANELNSCASQG